MWDVQDLAFKEVESNCTWTSISQMCRSFSCQPADIRVLQGIPPLNPRRKEKSWHFEDFMLKNFPITNFQEDRNFHRLFISSLTHFWP